MADTALHATHEREVKSEVKSEAQTVKRCPTLPLKRLRRLGFVLPQAPNATESLHCSNMSPVACKGVRVSVRLFIRTFLSYKYKKSKGSMLTRT